MRVTGLAATATLVVAGGAMALVGGGESRQREAGASRAVVAAKQAGTAQFADVATRAPTSSSASASTADALTFGQGVPISFPRGVLVTAVADVTGDRRNDLVALVNYDGEKDIPRQVHVFQQKGDGTLGAPVISAMPYGADWPLQMADLNRDGRQDIVLSGGNVVVGLGTASGAIQFKQLPRRWRDSPASSLQILDVNRDGWLDIAISETTDTMGVTAYLGDGLGNFTGIKLNTPLQGHVFYLGGGDFNADGYQDLISYREGRVPGDIALMASQDANRFATAHQFAASSLQIYPVMADWNGDGRQDLLEATGWWGDDNLSDFFALRYQSAEGQFQAPVLIPKGHNVASAVPVDLDNDGHVDLLGAVNAGWENGAISVHLQRDGVLQQGVKYPMPAGIPSGRWYGVGGVSAGDLNNDGCQDAVLTGSEPVVVVYYAAGCRQPQVGRDHDGDRLADIVWRNATTGANDMWRGGTPAGRVAMTTVSSLDWKIVGSGDFDGDGKADLLWRHATTGANDLWRSGSALLRQPLAAEADPAWRVAGVGDFDNDGRDDIFWRNADTGQNGVWWSANRNLSQPALQWGDQNWQVAGIGDFTGDARDDVLWRNNATGANELWPSASHVERRALTAVTSLPWKVAGVADFNGDGDADILWRNDTTGANTLWLFGKYTALRNLTTVADVNWEVAATADFDGDGKADILWRHKNGGGNELWSEANARFRKVLPAVGTAWQVMPR